MIKIVTIILILGMIGGGMFYFLYMTKPSDEVQQREQIQEQVQQASDVIEEAREEREQSTTTGEEMETSSTEVGADENINT